MKLYIFRCVARPRVYGATRFETASNLPTDRCLGGWVFCERVELTLRGRLRFAVDTRILRHHVHKNGWYVWDESTADVRRGTEAESKPVLVEQQLPPAWSETTAPVALNVPVAFDEPVAPAATVRPAAAEVAPARPVAMASPPEARAAERVTGPAARHQVVWFDIPVHDIDRAMRFYSAVLGTQLKKEQAGPGVATAELPHTEGSIGGCLVQSIDARPSEGGPLLYLNTDGRLDEALYAVEKYGGRVLAAMHSIAPFGFRAVVLDSEGNRIALHSMNP